MGLLKKKGALIITVTFSFILREQSPKTPAPVADKSFNIRRFSVPSCVTKEAESFRMNL